MSRECAASSRCTSTRRSVARRGDRDGDLPSRCAARAGWEISWHLEDPITRAMRVQREKRNVNVTHVDRRKLRALVAATGPCPDLEVPVPGRWETRAALLTVEPELPGPRPRVWPALGGVVPAASWCSKQREQSRWSNLASSMSASAALAVRAVAIGAESDHVRAALEQPEARPLRLPPAPGWHDRGCNMWM